MSARARRQVSWGGVFFGLALALFLAALAVVLFGYMALRGYLRGEDFRKMVERQVGRTLRVELDLAPLAWTGSSVYAESAAARGQPGTAVKSFQTRDLRTGVDLRALLTREVHLQPLDIARLELDLQAPTGLPHGSGEPAARPSSAWWHPKRVRLEEARAQRLTVHAPWFDLTDSQATLKLGGTTDLVLTGGRWQFPGLPAFGQDETRLRFMPDEVHVLESRGRVGDGGSIQASGVIGLAGAEEADLQMEGRDIDLKLLLPPAWRGILQGHATGTAHYTNEKDTRRLAGSIRSTDASLGVIPVLQLLRDFTGSERFAHVPLQELSADFTREQGDLTLRHIAIESNGLLRLEGECRTDGQTIDGTFQVGISPTVLRWIPGGYGKVFEENRGGFRWAPMRVSGPLSHPREDLSARLVAAIPAEVLDRTVEGAGQAEKVIKEGASRVLDTILGF